MEELKAPELVQSFEVTRQFGLRIKSVRPYLYIQGTIPGNFRVAIFSESIEIATTGTFTANDIRAGISTTNSYCAVNYFKNLLMPVFLKKGIYEIKLIHSGYSYSPNDFIAWIMEHEDIKNEMSYVPVDDTENTFAFDLFRF
jgi:hypothetical protein